MMLWNILGLLVILRVCPSQKIGPTVYLTRWRKVGLCAPSEVIIISGGSTLYETKEYWSGVFNVTQEFTAEKGVVAMQKCGEGFYPCENFIRMTGDKRVFENFLKTPLQAWSPVVNAFNPKLTSSHFEKGIYKITNATLDIEKATLIMPEFPNYYWKLTGQCWDKKDNPLFCFEAEFHVVKYTPRDKKTRKNNG